MKPWTEKHRREALRRTYEIAAEMAETIANDDRYLADLSSRVTSEAAWIGLLVTMPGLSAPRIGREVQRVRGLAEGRFVRETSEQHQIVRDDGDRPARFQAKVGAHAYVNDYARPPDHTYRIVPVRVTRIRRRS